MSLKSQFFIQGDAGKLECSLTLPTVPPNGLALIAHPHPLWGGNFDNKVVQILDNSFAALGYVTARMNFRGAGRSEGKHDFGEGETTDMLLLLNHLQEEYPDLPVALAGFSFGTLIQARTSERLAQTGAPVKHLILIAPTAEKWALPDIPSHTLIIHGERDDLIPLEDALNWASGQDVPVTVVPGADHLFNRKLHHLKHLIEAYCRL